RPIRPATASSRRSARARRSPPDHTVRSRSVPLALRLLGDRAHPGDVLRDKVGPIVERGIIWLEAERDEALAQLAVRHRRLDRLAQFRLCFGCQALRPDE